VPANGVDSTPLSKGRVGGDAIGRRLAVDLEFGREGENGGRSPCRRTMPPGAEYGLCATLLFRFSGSVLLVTWVVVRNLRRTGIRENPRERER
jgi:hypothetical protein